MSKVENVTREEFKKEIVDTIYKMVVSEKFTNKEIDRYIDKEITNYLSISCDER